MTMNFLRIRILDRRCIKSMIMQLQALNTSAFNFKDIQIPTRIERGPTDILEALESTISPDVKLPEYKFMHDPLLIPTTETQKRNFILSRESGKRAARWIIKEHGDIIKSELSEPLVQAFLPPPKYTEKSQVSNEILLGLIEAGSFTDALHVYKLLEEDVPLETKQALLEVMCYYNGEVRDLTEDYPEEQRYQAKIVQKSNQWQDNPEIDKLFQELKSDKTTAATAYNTMICGYGKFYSIKKATDLYAECVNNNIPISGKAYCYMIRLAPALKSNFEDCSLLIQKYLQEMIKNGIELNLETLNSILQCLYMSTFDVNHDVLNLYIITILKKFKSLGVEPCLATFYYLLLIYYPREKFKTGKFEPDVLKEIIKEAESTKFTMQDPGDEKFFPYAMSIIEANDFDVQLAHKVHEASEKNKIFFQIPHNKNKFYRSYLTAMLQSGSSFEEFLELYDKFVPQTYITDVTMFTIILDTLLMFKNCLQLLEALCKFLNQIVTFGLISNNNLMKLSYRVIEKLLNPVYLENNPQIKADLVNYAWKTWLHCMSVRRRVRYNYVLRSEVVRVLLNVLIEGDEYEKFKDVLTEVKSGVIEGVIKKMDVHLLLRKSITKNQGDAALLLLEYCNNIYQDEDVEVCAEIITSSLKLNEQQQSVFDSIVNKAIFKSNKPAETNQRKSSNHLGRVDRN